MMFGFRSYRSSAQVFVLLASLMAGSAFAQNYASMGISAVVDAADGLLRRGEYAAAIPALKEVIVRTEELDTTQGAETLQTSRFQLARALFQVGNSAEGMKVLEVYLSSEPRRQNHEHLALRMMAQGYLEAENWDKVIEFTQRLLDMSGLTDDDRLSANLLIGQALFRKEQWKECIDPLTFAMKNTKDEKVRYLCQIMSARALVESKQWGRLFVLVRAIYRTDAKYDITLNITLMQAGKTLFDEATEKELEEGKDDLLNALFLYRMVLPRKDLIDFANTRIAKSQTVLDRRSKTGIMDSQQEELKKEIATIKESITILSELPPYEDEVTFRIGQIYAEVKRYWEGFVLFNRLYEKDRNSEIGEASIMQSVLILYEVKEIELAEARILKYLDERPDGLYTHTLLAMLMRDNLMRENYARVTEMKPYVDRLAGTSAEDESLIEANIHYMLAFGYFLQSQFPPAVEQFSTVIEKYPESPSLGDCIYYRGMAYMMHAKYQEGMGDFLAYQEKGEDGEHYSAAMFREAVCLFGQEMIPESEAAFTKYIDAYPDGDLVSEAYSMRGDIEAAKDGQDNPATPDIDEYDPLTLDRALADYRKGLDSYKIPKQASYAAFQSATVYKLEHKWQDIIEIMDYYMNLLGDKADVAQAVFWKGQSQIELGQVDDAVNAYLDAIERFGNEADQEGVDKIVVGLVEIADRYLSETDKQGLVGKINFKLTSVDERAEVLKLRLRVTMAMLEGADASAALGAELVAAKTPLTSTSPISLALMCDAAVMAGDTALMGELYEYFTKKFDGSDHLWHAYRARTFQLLAEEADASVLATIGEAQDLFGVVEHMGWAQITKADTLYKMGDYEQAEKAYNTIMGVPEWRGDLYAEAYIGMASCRLATKDYETAHSYYQRTYLLFKTYSGGKWGADAYLGAADCLVRLGRNADAVNTLNEMLKDEYVNTLPQADTARELIKKYGGA